MIRPLLQVFLWLVAWVLLSYATRDHHPTPLLCALATAILEACTAVCVYSRRIWVRRGGLLGLLLGTCTMEAVAAAMIRILYMLLWHPDPRMYGFLFNWLADSLWIAAHLLAVSVLNRIISMTARPAQSWH